MPTTRSEHSKIMTHLLDLIGDGENGCVYKALKQHGLANTILDILSLDSTVIDSLTYPTDKGVLLSLNKGQQGMLKVVHAFNQSLVRSGTVLTVLDWLTIDHDTFDAFRISYNPYDYHLSSGRPSNPSSGSGVIRKQTSDALRDFKSGNDPSAPNLRLDFLDGEYKSTEPKEFIKSVSFKGVDQEQSLMIIKPEDKVGRTFLSDPMDNGERHRARIVKALDDHKNDLEKNPERAKFLCSFNDDEYEEIVTYNNIVDHIEKDQDDPSAWKFQRITAHEGPLSKSHPNYKGSTYNIMVEWETREITSEPLSIIAMDDPVTCAIYANNNNILDIDGWKRFKIIAKGQKKHLRMANQA